EVLSRAMAACRRASELPLTFAFCLFTFPFLTPTPVRPHLRQAFHVDRRALAFLFAVHGLEQIERPYQVVVDCLARRAEVEAADLGQLVVRREHGQLHECHSAEAFRPSLRSEER